LLFDLNYVKLHKTWKNELPPDKNAQLLLLANNVVFIGGSRQSGFANRIG